jgi:type VI secretion system secreted protein VgrG
MPDDKPLLLGVHGRERISRLFELDLVIARPAGHYTDDELDQLLKAPCALTLGPRPGDVVHGLLERIELIDSERHALARYVVRVVPNVWLLTLEHKSRIYQDTTVPDLVRTVLSTYGLKEGTHFRVSMRHPAKSPKHEYLVQYQESDWDFLQRWLEHEGFFYWFSHSAEGEMLVITDDNGDATPIEDPATVSYRERNNLSTGRVATIWSWNLLQRRIPARVVLMDYNYRTPSVALNATEVVDAQRGFGTVFMYGDNFKDKDVGAALAKVRAERFLCERRTFTGRTDCARFRAGHSFELENHYEAAFDAKYLITALDHRVGYPLRPDRDDLKEDPQRYLARFEAIPLNVAYRAERVTPWPRIHGVMHAKIDSDTSGKYADIDNQGRYRVRMPFNTNNSAKGGKASRWIRMAEPYAGAGYGTHYPLHKGTEVLIGHIDGDPDRPIIVGAVPNPETQSPSTSRNATQSVTQTASGIRIEMEDLQS